MSRHRPASRVSTIPRKWYSPGRWCVVFAMVIGGVGLWGWQSFQRPPTIPIPVIDLSKASQELSSAVTSARTKVEQQPRSADAWGDLGMWLMAHQFECEANQCLEQAARLDAKKTQWPYLLGISLSVSHRDRAIQEFRRVLSMQAHWPVAHLRLGELLLAEGELDAAAQELQLARQQEMQDPRTCYNLSRLAFLRGDLETALNWARRTAQIAPDVQSVQELLASIYQRMGNLNAAGIALRDSEQAMTPELGWNDELAAKVLSLRRDHGRQFEHAQSLLYAGQPDEAVRVLSRTLQKDQRDLRLFILLAKTLNQQGRRREVLELLAEAEKTHPNSAELRLQRGVAHFQAEQFEAAERDFREALVFKSDHGLAHYNLGQTLISLGRFAEAEQEFVAATNDRPSFVPAHLNAAKLQLKRGMTTVAQKHLRAALQADPDNQEAIRLLNETKLP